MRYGLMALAAPPPDAGPGTSGAAPADPTAFVLPTLLLMAVAPALITFLLGKRGPKGPIPPSQPGDIPPPPESLRHVRIFGKQFRVLINSGMIVEGAATKADAFPIRFTDGSSGEMWFQGGLSRFNASPGQLVSYVAARNRKGNYHFLLVYNHQGKDMHTFENITRGTKPPFFLPWLGATLIGFIGFGATIRPYVAIAAQQMGRSVEAGAGILLWVAAVTFFISALAALVPAWLTYSIWKGRNAHRFMAGYRVSYQTYFDQITPALIRHFQPRA